MLAQHPGRKTEKHYETPGHQTEAPTLVEPSTSAVPVEAPLEPLEVSAVPGRLDRTSQLLQLWVIVEAMPKAAKIRRPKVTILVWTG